MKSGQSHQWSGSGYLRLRALLLDIISDIKK